MTLNEMMDRTPSLHTGGVTGSIPVAPTSNIEHLHPMTPFLRGSFGVDLVRFAPANYQ
jgi:hypothetical protein